MPFFYHENRQKSDAAKRLYARYEMLYTGVDFVAAFAFLAGSILFFGAQTQTAATWLFVVGSICFALKPTLRLVREIRLYRMGQLDKLAERAES